MEDETGMANVTLWPDTWERLRPSVRRHALLLIDGELQREGSVVNVIAHAAQALPEVASTAGGPERPDGVRQTGYAGMRRLGSRQSRDRAQGQRRRSAFCDCGRLPVRPGLLRTAEPPGSGSTLAGTGDTTPRLRRTASP